MKEVVRGEIMAAIIRGMRIEKGGFFFNQLQRLF